MWRFLALLFITGLRTNSPVYAEKIAAEIETVYVETSFDTDRDGRLDRIYVRIERPAGATNVPTVLEITPYAFGGNDAPDHNVDVSRLPQDSAAFATASHTAQLKQQVVKQYSVYAMQRSAVERGYAWINAHSIGTGNSAGCPTVGSMVETDATKAVIDWLNGRAKAYKSSTNNSEVTAAWSSGNVGMIGVSYNGTLPNMVATTGVEGLKAIIPIAAITNWYDYYRANGLVVGPGGYVGEDADVLAKFIVRPSGCPNVVREIGQIMGREHGDFHEFWQERAYQPRSHQVTAATFIIHGQSDWNVRQKHAIKWWEALYGRVPLKMWLHKGGHSRSGRSDETQQMWAWYDRYVKGEQNGVEDAPAIEVQSPGGAWSSQQQWPHESTSATTFYLNGAGDLSTAPTEATSKQFVDAGKSKRMGELVANPMVAHANRLAFVSAPLATATMLSGTPKVAIELAVLNRKAANLSIAVVEYSASGSAKIVTRGWADPQNHADMSKGEKLTMGENYRMQFELEPKQYVFAAGSRIGVVVAATDYDYTIRPANGTEVKVTLGEASHIELNLSR